MKPRFTAAFLSLLLAAMLSPFAAQAQNNSAGGNTTFTVTAVSKKSAEISNIAKDNVQLFQGKDRKQIGDWKKGDTLGLAILIDDSIDSSAGGQWQYLKEFIMEQPATTSIMVGYIRNNGTTVAQDFTTSHELAAKALRLPIGIGALGSSPYLATIDLLKRWQQGPERRSIVLITSGIDFFRGSGWGMFYPDLEPLISRAQRQNTNIWTIYYPSASHRGRGYWLLNNAQTNIDKLSEDTGAESYFLGGGMPVSIKPYLDEISTHLGNQYLLTFAGDGGNKGKFVSTRVRSELPDVEFMIPASVFIPPTKL
ncbi:MAG TPA: hypothetical protein VL128_13125 [Candidatus Eisenbacteria bacterium]|nr:hypothetical protein [Candidatus Eisenbacteria bacterium]